MALVSLPCLSAIIFLNLHWNGTSSLDGYGKKRTVARGPLIEWKLDERERDLSHDLGTPGEANSKPNSARSRSS